jgi:alkylation response protein AidB-like acyl-CoA dehydrogenase
MALVFNDEQSMLRDSARGFLEQHSPVGELRRLRDEEEPGGFSRALWRQMADMGWAGMLVPEQHGGIDFGLVGAGIVCEEMGRVLCNAPFIGTAVTAVSLLRELGDAAQQDALLPAIAGGEAVVACALQEGARLEPAATALRAQRDGEGWRLSGRKTLVPDGAGADRLLVLARSDAAPGDDHGLSLFIVAGEAAGLTREPERLVDAQVAANLRFDDVVVGADALLGEAGQALPAVERALDRSRACAAAMTLGLADVALHRTVDYLKERRQFGVTIATFQALQHRAAHWFTEVELLRSISLAALQALDEQRPEARELATAAKAKACEVARLSGNEAVQMHGGIGMTDAYDIGFFIKRAATLRQLYGDRSQMEDRIAVASSF